MSLPGAAAAYHVAALLANIVLDDKWGPSSCHSDNVIMKRLILILDKECQSHHHVQAIRDMLAYRVQLTHPLTKTLQTTFDAGVPKVLKPWRPIATFNHVDAILAESASSIQRDKRHVPMDTDEEKLPPQNRASPVRPSFSAKKHYPCLLAKTCYITILFNQSSNFLILRTFRMGLSPP